MKIKRIGILPWVGTGDLHQILFKQALERQDIRCLELSYSPGLPISSALKRYDVDVLVLDWVHSFFTSKGVWITLLKTLLGMIDRVKCGNRRVPIIWNMHNLHRHDLLYAGLEKYSFKRLAMSVDAIRVFNKSSVQLTRDYLSLPSDYLVECIPQGPYPILPGDASRLQAAYPTLRDKKVLLFFGSIREGKGLLQFIKSFMQVNHVGIALLIAGKPVNKQIAERLNKLVAKTSEVILVDNFIEEERVPDFFLLADYVVLPYEHILNSGVFLLAQSYGKPVLAQANQLFNNEVKDRNSIVANLFDSDILQHVLEIVRCKKNEKTISLQINHEEEWNKIARKALLLMADVRAKYV